MILRTFIYLLCLNMLLLPLGCTRLKVASDGDKVTEAAAERSGVHFSAYRLQGDARKGEIYDDQVLSQLWLLRDGRFEMVHRDTSPSWSRNDLPAGEYVLEVLEIYDGEEAEQPNKDSQLSFQLSEGGVADVDLVLKQVPWAKVAIVTLGVVVVVGVVAYVVATQEMPELGWKGPFDAMAFAPTFTVVRPPLIVPHYAWHLWRPVLGPVNRLYIALDVMHLLTAPVYWGAAHEHWPVAAPRAVSFDPPVAPGDALYVSFDRPMEGFYFDPNTVKVLDSQGVTIPGSVYYDRERNTLSYHPLLELEPGAYEFVMLGELLVDTTGTPMGINVQWPFEIGGGESL